MKDFSTIKIESNNINKEGFNLSYTWSNRIYKLPMYNIELLVQFDGFKNGLISFDQKYGTNDYLEFNFIPIFIAHPNPPAQVNNYQNIRYE